LRFRQRVGLRIHLWLCRWCHRYGRQLRFLHSAAQQQDAQDSSLPEQQLRAEARERIKQRLQGTKE